jgi:glutathione S-transferase
MSNSKFF